MEHIATMVASIVRRSQENQTPFPRSLVLGFLLLPLIAISTRFALVSQRSSRVSSRSLLFRLDPRVSRVLFSFVFPIYL